MRKKLLIILLGLVGSFSVVYSFNKSINANVQPEYYSTGTTFTMGGMNWIIVKNNGDGTGYIQTPKEVTTQICNLGLVQDLSGTLSSCVSSLTTSFQSSANNDAIGILVRNSNASTFQTIGPVSVQDYIGVTNNGADTSYFVDYTWIDKDAIQGHYVFYHSQKASSQWILYEENGTVIPHLYYDSLAAAGNYIIPTYLVDLPQSNQLVSISSNQYDRTFSYEDQTNKKDEALFELTISKGEGPFRYYIYDTNMTGTTGNSQATSSFFQIASDHINGIEKITLKDTLPAGDYYFKVKVVDESTNTNLYHTPSDFTKDPARTKETGVIHVKVEKGTQAAITVHESSSDQAGVINPKTSFNIDKTDNSITLYPAGGASEISNHDFTYEVISDPNGILTNTPSKGSSGTFTLSHIAGTASVKITKPGGSNYKDASTTVQIVATSISDTPVIRASDGSKPYVSASKSNKDITLTFDKGPNGSAVNKALKLKELGGNTSPSADWYKTSGTESTITPGDTKTLTASSTQTYNCYWLYYDGYLNEGVEFRVDLLKDTLKIKNPQTSTAWLADNDIITTSGNSFELSSANHTLDTTKTKLYEQGNTSKTYPLTNVGEGTYTLHLEDAYGNMTDIDFKVLASLYFVKPNTNTKITKDEIEYDQGGIYKAEAKGSNNTLKYRVPNGNTFLQATSTSGEFELLNIGIVDVEAYTEDQTGATLSSVKMKVTITQGKQFITFDDANVTKRVKKGDTSFFETATGKRTSSNKAGIGGITYSSSEPSIIAIDPATGEATIGNKGTATITAILNDPKSSTYDANFETKTITKTIEVYEGMSVTFTPNHLQAEKTATLNAAVGTLTPTNNNGSVSYTIAASSNSNNTDKDWFKMNGSTIQLVKAVSGSDLSKHVGGNTFKVQVEVKDLDGTVTVDCVITISDAENDFYYVNPKNVTEKITSMSEVYKPTKTFSLKTHTSNGKPASYKLKDGQDPSIISVAIDGTVTMLKAGGPVQVEASVPAGSGYASKTITMPVTITASSQSIAFDTGNESIQLVINTTYSTPATLKEADGTVSTRLITYASETTSICTIDSLGFITMLSVGECKLKASNADVNYTKVTAAKTITIYDGMGGSFTQNAVPQAEKASGNSGTPVGSVSASGGQGTKTYHVSSSIQDNSEKDFFTITSAGVVSLKKNITASDLATLPQDSDGNYMMKVVFTAKDSLNNMVDIKAEIKVKGAESKAEFDTGGTGMISKPYSPNGTFTTEIINNAGHGTPEYSLKQGADLPIDVLKSIDPVSGIVTIENAVEGTKYAYLQAKLPASGGYCEATIEVPVNITKAEQDISFKKKVINLQTESSLQLEVIGILSKQPDGSLMNWSMASQDSSLVKVKEHTITGTKKEGSTTVTVSVKGDRNYKAGSATVTIHVSSAPAYDFSITVPHATYGDYGLAGDIFIDDGTGNNKKRVWTSSDERVATIDPDTGELTILKAGKTTITCTQTSDGEPSVNASAVFVVDPKPISVTIENETKKVGEALPQFHAVINPSDLIGNDTIGQPVFGCKDQSNKPVTNQTTAGEYEITGTYPTGTYPNYDITVTSGSLTITQDESSDTWFELIGAASSDLIASDTWVGEDIYVTLRKAESTPYDQISLNNKDWQKEHILVDTEGIINTAVYFQKSDTQATSKPRNTIIKIDKTPPMITSISGQNEHSTIKSILNTLTLGQLFKPGMIITIEAEDQLPKGISDQTMMSGVNSITYEITKLDENGKPAGQSETKTKTGSTVELTLSDLGVYQVCASATDKVGRISSQSCKNIKIIQWGESSDEKELPDINIDLDHDGVADINITRPGETKPYLNIDTNGDGIPDINISKQGEEVIPGKTEPYLNIIGLEVNWNPNKEIDFDGDGEPDFRIDASLSAILSIDSNDDHIPNLNIDLDGDYVADLNIDVNGDRKTAQTNIDTTGDGKADINIDTNGDGTPDSRIATSYEWKPTYLVKDKEGNVMYGTTQEIKLDTIDSVTDQGFIIKPSDSTQQFLPNYALKVSDITASMTEEMKQEIVGSSKKEDYEIAGVYEITLKANDKIIQPDGSVEVSVPYDPAWGEVVLMKLNKNGDWEEVTAEIVGDYLKFTTDYIGEVSILKQKQEEPTPEPEPTTPEPDPTIPEPNPTEPNDPQKPTTTNPEPNSSTNEPKPSVQGVYTPYSNTGMGGASTWDSTNIMMYLGIGFTALGILTLILFKRESSNQ